MAGDAQLKFSVREKKARRHQGRWFSGDDIRLGERISPQDDQNDNEGKRGPDGRRQADAWCVLLGISVRQPRISGDYAPVVGDGRQTSPARLTHKTGTGCWRTLDALRDRRLRRRPGDGTAWWTSQPGGAVATHRLHLRDEEMKDLAAEVLGGTIRASGRRAPLPPEHVA